MKVGPLFLTEIIILSEHVSITRMWQQEKGLWEDRVARLGHLRYRRDVEAIVQETVLPPNRGEDSLTEATDQD